MSASPTIVLVAGMHRSGTSLAARLLTRIGCYTRGRLMKPDAFNPQGYWEDIDVVRLHDRILEALDCPHGHWRAALPMPDGWLDRPEIRDVGRELEALVVSAVAAADAPWVVKDPRLCRLLPLWLSIAGRNGIELRTLISVRPPGAVAASLEARDRLPPEFARVLWLASYADMLTASDLNIAGVVSYDRWYTDADTQMATLARAAGIAVERPALQKLVADAVTPSLRHHQVEVGDGMADRLYMLADRWAATGERPGSLSTLAEAVMAALVEFGPLMEAARNPEFLREALEAKVDDYRARTDDLQSLVWRLKRPLAALRSIRSAIGRLRGGRTDGRRAAI